MLERNLDDLQNYRPQKMKLMCYLKVFLILLFLVLSAATRTIPAQGTSTGITPNGSKVGTPVNSSISNIEKINTYGGKLNVVVPLLNVGGRGEVGYQITAGGFNLNWTFIPVDSGNPNAPREYMLSNGGGDRPGRYTPGGMLEKRAGDGPIVPYLNCEFGGHERTITYYTFIFPNGDEKIFYDALTNGATLPAGYCFNNTQQRGRVFYSADGDGTTFISDTPILDYNAGSHTEPGGTGFLKFKNGITYRIQNSNVQWMKDRNGNTITFTYQYGALIKITDSLNREINISYQQQNYQWAYDEITYKGANGNARTIRVNYSNSQTNSAILRADQSLKTVWELFPDLNTYNGNQIWHFGGISSIELPNQQNYQFQYNSYGELGRVKMPSGSAIEYDYFGSGQTPNPDGYIFRRLTERRFYSDGSALTNKIGYSVSVSPNYITEEHKNGSGALQYKIKHNYLGVSAANSLVNNFQVFHTSWQDGLENQTDFIDADGSTLLQRTVNNWSPRNYRSWGGETPQIITTDSITEPNGANLIKREDYSYDQFGNRTDVFEYDFGTGAPGNFKRRTHTDYKTDANYIDQNGVHLRGLPLQIWFASDVNGNTKTSITQFEYDNYYGGSNNLLTDRANVVGHDAVNYSTNTTVRGNVTRATTYENAQNQTGAISTYSHYDILGNVVEKIDAKGLISTIDFTDRFGSPDGEALSNTAPAQLNGQNTFAFQTSSRNSMGWITGYTQHDYYTGLTIDFEDINGVVGTTFYNDPLDRPTQSIEANNIANFRRQKTIIYNDISHTITTTTDLFSFGDNLSKSEEYQNTAGQITEKRSYESNNIYVVTKMEYDNLGRVYRTTSPYRPTLNEIPQWSSTKYDSLGRTIEVETPDNTKSLTSYIGNAIVVTDRAGRQRRSIYDAFGQIIRVDEPDQNGNIGTISSPTQPTAYEYNLNGQMTEITQGSQKRYFLFDSLGRLLRLKQPEQEINSSLTTTSNPNNNQWSAGFTYDANGNVLTSIDANGTIVTKTYDNLNRPLIQNYSDGTPTINYKYDESTVPNSKGRLTEVSNSISTSKNVAFDVLGRALTYQQITDGKVYTSTYQYNLSSVLVQETYPSGKIVKNNFSIDGKLSKLEGIKNGQTNTYLSDVKYLATGAVEKMRLGNGMWENANFNSRQQITELSLGYSANDSSAWKIKYEYGKMEIDGTLSQEKNTGNVARQTISYQGLAQPYVQTYQYDSLNRLIESKELSNTQQNWKQNWTYDQYGNRLTFNQVIGSDQLPINNVTSPTSNLNTNRFNSGQGYNYDKNGNLVQDALGRTFIFNGDNKQVQVKDLNQNVIGLYYYDGEGKRVKKVTNTETTVFVYSSGKLIAEYSEQISQQPQVNYLTTDKLGSPRIITNQNREIVSRRDFMPFGEEIYAGVGQRSEASKYSLTGLDSVRQRFTGYQKDSETDLDFAQARYYYSKHGRFTAVDPLITSGKFANPQTFNRYVYVLNNPSLHIDANGLDVGELSFETFVAIVAQNFKTFITIPGGGTGTIDSAAINQIANILFPTAQEIYRTAFNAQRALIRSQTNNGITATAEVATLTRNEVSRPASTATGSSSITSEQSADATGTATGTASGSSGGEGSVTKTLSGAIRTGTKIAGTLTGSSTVPTSDGTSSAVQVSVSDKASPDQQRAAATQAAEMASGPLTTQITNNVVFRPAYIVGGTTPPASSGILPNIPSPTNPANPNGYTPAASFQSAVINTFVGQGGVVSAAETAANSLPAPVPRIPPPPPPPPLPE